MPQELRNDLNGLRLRLPGNDRVYLVDRGKKRHVPDPRIYDKIFSTWDDIFEDINVNQIPDGPPLWENVRLFTNWDDREKIYFLDKDDDGATIQRHITSPAVMDRYKFRWDNVHADNHNPNQYPEGPAIYNP